MHAVRLTLAAMLLAVVPPFAEATDDGLVTSLEAAEGTPLGCVVVISDPDDPGVSLVVIPDPEAGVGYLVQGPGSLRGLSVDSAILETQLTMLVQDRQRFIETVSNALKAMDDALANTIRRIV